MRGQLLRRGHKIGDVQHMIFDGDQLRFTTDASLAFSQYEVRLAGRPDLAVLVVSRARDGRGPSGEQAPGRTRVTAIQAARAAEPMKPLRALTAA
jgi:hypothetical protein